MQAAQEAKLEETAAVAAVPTEAAAEILTPMVDSLAVVVGVDLVHFLVGAAAAEVQGMCRKHMPLALSHLHL
jgi:hypothetical protein